MYINGVNIVPDW